MATKVFFSCALGAFVGALVALQLWQPIWWVGMLVGGFVGYCSFELKRVIVAAPVAWRHATSAQAYERWAAFWVTWFNVMCLASHIICFAAIISYAMRDALPLVLAATTGTAVSVVYGCLAALFTDRERIQIAGVAKYNAFFMSYHLLRWSWLAVPILMAQLQKARVGLLALARALAGAVPIGKSFLWHLFIQIHSELRLLCGLDAAIGAGVGYLCGNALIGALAGGLFGLLNYQVVSVWWLRLVPSRPR